ncbi:hypothetical protein FHG64_12055 [Antarcticibacterium flavum]|uniref:Uncharacterized protein n=1 Tax=Antarcticibacterium flavum TaxID=2058175 RepID=A0A5B7X3D7_9FLAO|nr:MULTISPECIES: hypothetical protein [Antarcticibacterium]MCM4158308.1 hypothetical protein [Antarcticibacterium sp. W02-3]QCY70074.1 hypothetical protein FHG64_12055 [Antarcticibacterium flavum]
MKLYNLLYQDFEELFVGYSALAVILSSCIGSAAALVILMNGHDVFQMAQLFLVVVVCMTYNATVLAQLKAKIVFNSLIISLVVSTLLIIYNVYLRYQL